MTKLKILTLLLLVIMIVGCQAQVDLSQPPEILYGEEVCTECGMIISEPRFAAAYYTPEGDARRFDDIGGMLTHHAANQEEVAQFWVHDYETEEWIVAGEAYFVRRCIRRWTLAWSLFQTRSVPSNLLTNPIPW